VDEPDTLPTAIGKNPVKFTCIHRSIKVTITDEPISLILKDSSTTRISPAERMTPPLRQSNLRLPAVIGVVRNPLSGMSFNERENTYEPLARTLGDILRTRH
jgi:hypothetical protein